MSLELTWVERDLRSLERAGTDALVCSLFADDRPPHGALGLADWRLCGRVSSLCTQDFLTGVAGELTLIPVRKYLPYDKLLVLGLGERSGFEPHRCRGAIERLCRALADLQVRRATVELPGRQLGLIDAAPAFEQLVSVLGDPRGEGPQNPHFEFETLTLVDDGEAQRAYAEGARLWRLPRRS